MSDNWRELSEQAAALPYGRARTVAAEKALQLATRDGASEEELFWLRMALTEAYEHGGEEARAFTPFSRCLSAFDADPARYGPEAYKELLWQFKWMVSSLLSFPEIPLDRTMAVLDDMERRYREGGHSLHSVHSLRCRVARHVGDTAAADAAFQQMRTTATDETSDCEGCVPSMVADYLVGRGDHEEAIAAAEPVLSGQLNCIQQPQRILTVLIEPYLYTGRHREAADAHRRAYRVHRREDVRHLSELGRHLFFCALTGNHARGLEILERHLGALDTPPNPHDAMEFAASAALLLDQLAAAGYDGLTVRRPAHGDRPEAEVGVADLRDQMRAHAYAIAARFDARNGTTAQTDWVRGRLAAEPVLESLPLTEYAPRPRTAVPAPAPQPAAEAPAEDWADLLEQAERWWREVREEQARAAWRRFDELTAGVDLPAWALGRRAAGEGRMREDDGDLAGAAEHYRAAADHYAAAGRETDHQWARAKLGALLVHTGSDPDGGMALVEEAVAHMDRHSDPCQWADARMRYAACLAVRGDLERARTLLEQTDTAGTTAGLRYGALHLLAAVLEGLEAPFAEQDAVLARAREAARESGVPRLVATAAYRHAHLLRHQGEEEQKAAWQAIEEAAAQPASALPGGLHASIEFTRGRWLCEEQDHGAAVAPLAEAVAQAASLGLAPLAAQARFLLVRAYYGSGRYFDAAEAAEELLASGEGLDEADHRALRGLLAAALTELEEYDEALARWQELLDIEDEERNPEGVAVLRTNTARLLEVLNRPGEAAERYTAAAETWERLGRPYPAAELQQRAALLLERTEGVDAALAASRRAERLLERCTAGSGEDVTPEDLRFQLAQLRHERAFILWQHVPAAEVEAELLAAVDLYREVGADDAVQHAEELLARVRAEAE